MSRASRMLRPLRAASFAAAIAVVTIAGGCSWLLMDRAPAESSATSASEPPRCTETDGWAIWDTALGTSSIVVGGVQLSVAHETGRPGTTRTLGVANVALGGIYIASALMGYHRAAECARARDAYFAPERPGSQ